MAPTLPRTRGATDPRVTNRAVPAKGSGRGRLLVAAGVAGLAVAVLAATRGAGHRHGPAYPPLDTPKPVADELWIVDGTLPGPIGAVIGARMTVMRLPSGQLVLHSPTRFSPGLLSALERLGPIGHLVAPNLAHLSFIADWKRACPSAVLWAAPGVEKRPKVKRGAVRIDRVLREAPPEWRGIVDVVPVSGGGGFTETALFHRPTATLVLTDLVINLEPPKVPAPLRPLVRLFGSTAPDGMPPPYLRALLRLRRGQLAEGARHLLALRPERVIFSHGQWFERDGAARLRRSLRWALDR